MRTYIKGPNSEFPAQSMAKYEKLKAEFEADPEIIRILETPNPVIWYQVVAYRCPQCGHEYYYDAFSFDVGCLPWDKLTSEEEASGNGVDCRRKLFPELYNKREKIKNEWREKTKDLVYEPTDDLVKSTVDLGCPLCGSHAYGGEYHYFYNGLGGEYADYKYADPIKKHYKKDDPVYIDLCRQGKSYIDYIAACHTLKEKIPYDSIEDSCKNIIEGCFHATEEEIPTDKYSEHIEELNRQYDVEVVDCGIPDVKGIPSDPERLKEYISALLNLENNIYAINKNLPTLYIAQEKAKSEAHQKELSLQLGFKPIVLKEKELAQKVERLSDFNVAEEVSKRQVERRVITEPVKPEPPVLATPGFFNKKKVAAENEAKTQLYNAQLETYKVELTTMGERQRLADDEYQRELAKAEVEYKDACVAATEKNKADLAETQAELASVRQQLASCGDVASTDQGKMLAKTTEDIAESEKLLKDSYLARNQLYAANIVFGKYRDQVALASFYEYLMSGRCDSLTGPTGCYNIYEAEIRANRVIDSLDKIVDQLDAIKKNQYTLYSELSSINASLNSISTAADDISSSMHTMQGTLNEVLDTSRVTAYNTAVTGFYSKLNASLTGALLLSR